MRNKLKLQTLIFDNKFYTNKRKVKDWVLRNDFKLDKRKKDPVDKFANTYRVRQRNPDWFQKKTFRTKQLSKGIKGVYGYLKKR